MLMYYQYKLRFFAGLFLASSSLATFFNRLIRGADAPGDKFHEHLDLSFAVVCLRAKISGRRVDAAQSHAMGHGADGEMKPPQEHILRQVGKSFSHGLKQ